MSGILDKREVFTFFLCTFDSSGDSKPRWENTQKAHIAHSDYSNNNMINTMRVGAQCKSYKSNKNASGNNNNPVV